MIKRAFSEHPASVGETYREHMAMAFGFGSKMLLSGLACMIHGVFPFLFVRTGRNCIADLHDRLVVNRCAANPVQDDASAPGVETPQTQFRDLVESATPPTPQRIA